MSFDLKKALNDWAEKQLASMGVSREKISYLEKIKQKMIDDLSRLYSEKGLELYFNPVKMRKMKPSNGFARISGPCGDTMEVYLNIEDGMIRETSFQTDGCMPSIMSGGMAVMLAEGKSSTEASQIGQVTILEALGGLPEESKHCALLASNTLRMAIENYLSSRG